MLFMVAVTYKQIFEGGTGPLGPLGVIDIDVCVSSHLKEELAWVVGKQLWVTSTILLRI